MARILLGLSFNAESVKAVAIDINSGNMIGRAVDEYEVGVIRKKLPTGERIPPGFMLADPRSWLVSMSSAVEKLLDETGIPSSEILSVGVSMGSCVVLPTDASGVPLCLKDEFKNNPHSWPKLWNHKSSFKQAKKMTKIARDRGEPFLEHTGNRVSTEWLWPKLLEVIEESPEVADAMEWYIEGSDWIVWQLTGKQVRNQCSAGFKACYVEGFGYPSGSYFEAVSFDLARQAAKIKDIPIIKPGRYVGNLLPEAAQKLGLMPGTPVGAGVASNHVGVAGAGIYSPDTLTIVFGDSTAQMLMSVDEKIFEGYSCAVKDGIIDGFWGYEAGQPGTGKLSHGLLIYLHHSLYERSMMMR
ncbi:MAG: FGGY family carbohydrate kinase [Caldisericia bacterium]